jgi:hypothetical protein
MGYAWPRDISALAVPWGWCYNRNHEQHGRRRTGSLIRSHGVQGPQQLLAHPSSIDMYNNDVGQESAQKFMKQTGDLKAATLYFAS